jgi:hypothetical protein
MKRFTLAAGLLGLILVSGGCDRGTTAPAPRGELRGVLDDGLWLGDAQVDFSRDTFAIWSRRRNVRAEHSLGISVAQTAPGVYAVITQSMSSSRATSYWETLGDDIVQYHATATSGTISFTKFDRAAGRAVGTVELTLQGPRGTTRFVRGEFDARAIVPVAQ